MLTDEIFARVSFIRGALLKNPSDNIDNGTAVWICDAVLSYDEALRSALDLVRRFPCDHSGKIYSKDTCLRCQTLEAIGTSFHRGNGKASLFT